MAIHNGYIIYGSHAIARGLQKQNISRIKQIELLLYVYIRSLYISIYNGYI